MQTLRLFCDVAKFHSFSQAASKHSITQSAVSQRINQLEKKLGVKLIDRSVRPLALTTGGQTFLCGCRELLSGYDRLEQQVSTMGPQPGESVAGEIRVDAIYSAGIGLLSHVKDAFEQQWPKAKVIFEYKHPDEVFQAVLDRHCDLGIVSYPNRWRKVRVIPLRNEPMGLVCNPDHPLVEAGRVTAASLADWPMVSFESSLPVGRHIRSYLRERGVTPAFSHVFDNIDTIKTMVAVTDQVAILPKRTVQREVKAGVLAVVELEPPLDRPMGLIYRKSRSNGSLTPTAEAFVETLQQMAGPNEADVQVASSPGVPLLGDRK